MTQVPAQSASDEQVFLWHEPASHVKFGGHCASPVHGVATQ
jgi:hypothetical protein